MIDLHGRPVVVPWCDAVRVDKQPCICATCARYVPYCCTEHDGIQCSDRCAKQSCPDYKPGPSHPCKEETLLRELEQIIQGMGLDAAEVWSLIQEQQLRDLINGEISPTALAAILAQQAWDSWYFAEVRKK